MLPASVLSLLSERHGGTRGAGDRRRALTVEDGPDRRQAGAGDRRYIFSQHFEHSVGRIHPGWLRKRAPGYEALRLRISVFSSTDYRDTGNIDWPSGGTIYFSGTSNIRVAVNVNVCALLSVTVITG